MLVVVHLRAYFTAGSRQRSNHKTNASSSELMGQEWRLLLIGGKSSTRGAYLSGTAEVAKHLPIFPCCCGATGEEATTGSNPFIPAVCSPGLIFYGMHVLSFHLFFLNLCIFLRKWKAGDNPASGKWNSTSLLSEAMSCNGGPVYAWDWRWQWKPSWRPHMRAHMRGTQKTS